MYLFLTFCRLRIVPINTINYPFIFVVTVVTPAIKTVPLFLALNITPSQPLHPSPFKQRAGLEVKGLKGSLQNRPFTWPRKWPSDILKPTGQALKRWDGERRDTQKDLDKVWIRWWGRARNIVNIAINVMMYIYIYLWKGLCRRKGLGSNFNRCFIHFNTFCMCKFWCNRLSGTEMICHTIFSEKPVYKHSFGNAGFYKLVKFSYLLNYSKNLILILNQIFIFNYKVILFSCKNLNYNGSFLILENRIFLYILCLLNIPNNLIHRNNGAVIHFFWFF